MTANIQHEPLFWSTLVSGNPQQDGETRIHAPNCTDIIVRRHDNLGEDMRAIAASTARDVTVQISAIPALTAFVCAKAREGDEQANALLARLAEAGFTSAERVAA